MNSLTIKLLMKGQIARECIPAYVNTQHSEPYIQLDKETYGKRWIS